MSIVEVSVSSRVFSSFPEKENDCSLMQVAIQSFLALKNALSFFAAKALELSRISLDFIKDIAKQVLRFFVRFLEAVIPFQWLCDEKKVLLGLYYVYDPHLPWDRNCLGTAIITPSGTNYTIIWRDHAFRIIRRGMGVLCKNNLSVSFRSYLPHPLRGICSYQLSLAGDLEGIWAYDRSVGTTCERLIWYSE